MENEVQYQKALDYLYSFVDYSLTKSSRYSVDKFNLGRMHALVEALGAPHRGYPAIHIAGTKGKGSVASLCSTALRAAGYRVGLYTSPHLHDYTERIQLDGQPIAPADLVGLIEAVKPHVAAIPELTTFEITTALAFMYFSRRQVDAAVFEVGLGGRLDATNVVTPTVSVITSLSYDHTFLLGNTLAEIAGEKGGIIKPGVPVVLAPQELEARLVIERIAAERNSPLIQVGQDFQYELETRSLDCQTLRVWQAPDPRWAAGAENAETSAPAQLTIPLLGYHQVQNAATAYAALQVFSSRALPIDQAALARGFAQVAWPGRFEILQREPPIVVDSAHNRDSAQKLRQALDDYFPGRPVILLFGASEDKDVEGMFTELMPRVQQVVATQSFHPRALEPECLVELAKVFDRPVKIVSDVAQAFEEAVRLAGGEQVVLVAGSLFVAAGAREAWQARLGSQVL